MGGFGPSSLLFHALTIGRQRMHGESWSELYQCKNFGKSIFAHHVDYKSVLNAGLLRRERRRKTVNVYDPKDVEEEQQVKDQKHNRKRTYSLISDRGDHDYGESIYPSFESATFLQLTIARKDSDRWGITLVQEGNNCVVERVPPSSPLQPGDQIIIATNEHSERVLMSDIFSISNDGFFEMIGLFKKSLLLQLKVKRSILKY